MLDIPVEFEDDRKLPVPVPGNWRSQRPGFLEIRRGELVTHAEPRNSTVRILGLWLLGMSLCHAMANADEHPSVSGIFPHLAMFNNEAECGTGAVVSWADRLWVITYGPHLPLKSSDRLYEIDADLRQTVRPESVGGTHANRMIHTETGQLVIGRYVIDAEGAVRAIAPAKMPGRLTGTARHLSDPARKVYFATMEEGLYEVDLKTLEVVGLIRDWNGIKADQLDETHPATFGSKLPGYHGKGLYTGQGRLIYSNNGEHGPKALADPTTPSGALAEWRGEGDWTLVRRNQFTEVSGPGGIRGNERGATDPVWSIGWDVRSLILMVLDGGEWKAYRLPKGSHSYDGAHGWNTEWPRIRDIGEDDLLMTMHGTFWRFPRTMSHANTAGIAPRSNYLKVVGDFCRWQDRIVFGCDDTAKSEFLNKRKAKGSIAGPGQSQSNLWFVEPERLDQLGPVIGRGAVWLNDDVMAETPSDPYLFAGYERRGLHLAHESEAGVTFTLEVDAGDGAWRTLRTVEVPPHGARWVAFSPEDMGTWIRVRTDREAKAATAFFQSSAADERSEEAAPIFAGIAKPADGDVTGGLVYARGANLRTLRLAAETSDRELGCYDLDADLKLRRVEDPEGFAWTQKNLAIPQGVLETDAASVLYVDEAGRRWRLPKGDPAFDSRGPLGLERICREVCTERDLFNAHGTFYELPAENAGGFAKIRPVATHNRRIKDYASWRGLLVITGIADDAPADNPRIVRSEDGRCALWVGAVDDLWQFGKPRGTGGPWKETAVKAGEPSDAYLMTGYDRKRLWLSHSAKGTCRFRIEVDISGMGDWKRYDEIAVPVGERVEHRFPEGFGAYWVRVVSDIDTTATATFVYE